MSWKKSGNNLDAAEDAYREAVRIHGEDSPQACAADEAAFAASDQHFGAHGNPNDQYRTS